MPDAVTLKNVKYSVIDGEKMRYVLDDVSYTFEANKLTVISGSSGAGKSTLLHAIGGLLDKIDYGDVNVFATSIYSLSVKKRDLFRLNNVSMIFQSLNLFPFMSVKENICVPFYIKEQDITKAIDDKIEYYLKTLGLGSVLNRELKSLSGGEQQRIAIIRAIIDNPKLLLCDEPTANLDRKNSTMFLTDLKNIIVDEKITAIVVSHDSAVTNFADNIVLMDDGKLC
jgi:putative ABC transport system ATP-binding protein